MLVPTAWYTTMTSTGHLVPSHYEYGHYGYPSAFSQILVLVTALDLSTNIIAQCQIPLHKSRKTQKPYEAVAV